MKKNSIWIVVVVGLIAGGCNNSGLEPSKSAQITIKADPAAGRTINSGRQLSTDDNPLELNSVVVSISNVRIEENSGEENSGGETSGEEDSGEGNSGNDQQGNFDNDDGGGDTETDNSDAKGDIELAGPFTLVLSSGIVTIANVSVFPGTYKKVSFAFTVVNGSSIEIKGSFNFNGMSVPFHLVSRFDHKVQVPLNSGGITVTANSSKDISIFLDVKQWLGSLDPSTAIINGSILIDDSHNVSLLDNFENNLIQHIDADED